MTTTPDPAMTALESRLAALELMIVRMIGAVTITALIGGALLPWITEGSGEDARTSRLGTFAFTGLPEDLEGVELVLLLSFVVLDLTTIAAIVCVGCAMAGDRVPAPVGNLVIGLLACCMAGSGLLSLIGTANLAESGDGEVFWSSYAVWTLGAISAMWVLTTRFGRRPPP